MEQPGEEMIRTLESDVTISNRKSFSGSYNSNYDDDDNVGTRDKRFCNENGNVNETTTNI